MTDTEVTEGVTVETIPTPPAEAGFSLPETQDQGSDTTPPERDYEAEARDMGWVPEEEFKGDKKPAKFLDAKEFVERGETVLPFVQRENRRLKERLDTVEKSFDDRVKKLTKAAEMSLKSMQDQHARELAALQDKREKAVEAGNVAEFRKLDKQIADHAAAAPTIEDVAEPEAPAAVEDNAAVEAEWVAKNDWYEKDEAMTQYAFWYSNKIRDPKMPLSENLKRTEQAVREKFPMHFAGKSGANGHAPVDNGGAPKSPKSASPTFDKLPKEAQDFARSLKQSGGWTGSLEEWAKAYNS